MSLIAPGRNVVCIRAVECQWCGSGRASEGAVYMCESVADGGPLHSACCCTTGCDGFVLLLAGKSCCYCACCFKPLDDGDTSLVNEGDENPYDTPAPTAPSEREKERA